MDRLEEAEPKDAAAIAEGLKRGATSRISKFTADGKFIKLAPKDGLVSLHVLLDIASVEVVAGGGENMIVSSDGCAPPGGVKLQTR